jgi:hypothetical protein
VGLSVYPLLMLGNGSVNTFPRQRRINGGVVFYAVGVVSKESRRLVPIRTSCLLYRSGLEIVCAAYAVAFIDLEIIVTVFQYLVNKYSMYAVCLNWLI